MISIIICGRNDNYGGHFNERLFSTVSYNISELRKRRVSFELIFVEWNPNRDDPLLSEELAERFPEVRCFVVDGLIHHLISENRRIKVFEYHAKNVGARRARGSWLLLTNPDNYFGDEVLDFLQAGEFDPKAFYRAGRVQIDRFEDIGQPGFIDESLDAKPPYGGAPGDYFFCLKETFDSIGGFREDIAFSNTHMDSILNLRMFEVLKRVHKIGVTYHLRHEREQHAERRLDFDFGKVVHTPQEDFGQIEAIETPLGHPRIIELTLPADLEAQAKSKQPVEALIPAELRREPPKGQGIVERLRSAVTRFLNSVFGRSD